MADRAKSAGMTSWSRHDPVHKAGNTDHWTKLKVRNNTYRATDDGAKVVPDHTIDQKRWMNNEYQKRAKDNFRYWLINRPPPTSFGKYGIGSYKMVMGLGMAPRT